MVHAALGVRQRWERAGLDLALLDRVAVTGYDLAHELHLDRYCGRLRDQLATGYLHDRQYRLTRLPTRRCWACCTDTAVLQAARWGGRSLAAWVQRADRVRHLDAALDGTTDAATTTVLALELAALTDPGGPPSPLLAAARTRAAERLAGRDALLDPGALVAATLGHPHPGTAGLATGTGWAGLAARFDLGPMVLAVAPRHPGDPLVRHHLDAPAPRGPAAALLAAWLSPRPTVRWLPAACAAHLAAAARTHGWACVTRLCPDPAGTAVAAHLLATGLDADVALPLAAATVA